MLFSADTPSKRLLKAAVDMFAANSDVAAFFEGRITAAASRDYGFRIPTPSLLVRTVKDDPRLLDRGVHMLEATFAAEAILPVPTPARSFLATPAAPTVAAPGTSITYRISQVSPAGESWASDPVASSGITTLTLPALSSGATCFRIWRSLPACTACRWVGASHGSGTWADSASYAMGDELAPVFGLPETVRALLESAARASVEIERLQFAGGYLARWVKVGALDRGETPRGQWALSLPLTYGAEYDPGTQVIKVQR